MGNGRTYCWPWDCIPERGHRPQTIRLQTLDGMDFMYHSGVSPFLRSGKGGKRRGQSAECSSCQMTQKGKSVTLTLYSSPVRAIPQPSARRAVKLKNPRARKGQSILRTVPFTTLLHNLRRHPRPFFIKLAAEPLPPPFEPSHRRCVQCRVPFLFLYAWIIIKSSNS